MKSTPCRMPNTMSAASFSVMPGSETATPGTLRPLLLLMGPLFSTRQWISVPWMSSTVSAIRPSSMRIVEPTSTSSGSPLCETGMRSLVPKTSSVVKMTVCPRSSSTGSVANLPSRISGPFVSNRMATVLPSSPAACRMLRMLLPWVSKSPWEKLRRATFMPASINFLSISGESLAGPMVQTIFVLRI